MILNYVTIDLVEMSQSATHQSLRLWNLTAFNTNPVQIF